MIAYVNLSCHVSLYVNIILYIYSSECIRINIIIKFNFFPIFY